MKKSSELTILFSNCLSGGTAWNTISSELVNNIYEQMNNIEGFEFRKINSNTVRGEHNSFTLILSGVFYNLEKPSDQETISNLLEYLRNAANMVPDFTYSEIRIEHTRHYSIFTDLEHSALAKMV